MTYIILYSHLASSSKAKAAITPGVLSYYDLYYIIFSPGL